MASSSGAFDDISITRAPALIRNQVADHIRRAIVEMRVQPGEVLVERELSEATTASRASVREALRQLESEGLVTSNVGKGTFVTRLTAHEATEIYEVRARLEGLAGQLFAQNATQAHMDELWNTVNEVADAVDDSARMLRAKAKFYDVLFEGSGNSELQRILRGIHARATLVRATTLASPGRAPHTVEEITAIAHAAQAREPEQTAELCIEHIENAAKAARSRHLPEP